MMNSAAVAASILFALLLGFLFLCMIREKKGNKDLLPTSTSTSVTNFPLCPEMVGHLEQLNGKSDAEILRYFGYNEARANRMLSGRPILPPIAENSPPRYISLNELEEMQPQSPHASLQELFSLEELV
ncbi:hypothetical protein POM88_052773 [Heracleum sosnowskyi]|uniref:Uncharacterized protein n=1 Tax=Heracleum sosnowskyi TaxID=360622 RepID=A0AAD8LWB5_9APIA|nr:hypothetical protein POM88_052773 [Heracleum sosnowskyi]